MTSPHDDLPPAFPEWLKRRIPLLRAEETNVLFQIFRRRRELYPPSGLARILDFLPTCTVIMWAVMFLLFAFPKMSPRFYAVNASPLLFLFVAFQIAARLLNRWGARNNSALPTKVSEVFDTTRWRIPVARDLYLTGIKGSEIFEAILLEGVNLRWKATILVSGLFTCAPFLLIYPRQNFGNPVLFIVSCLATIGAGVCFWCMTITELQASVVARELEKRLIWWGDELVEEKIVSSASGIVERLGVAFVGFMGIGLLSYFSTLVGSRLMYPTIFDIRIKGISQTFLIENAHLTKAIASSLGVGALCLFATLVRSAMIANTVRDLVAKADHAFKSHARRVICEDTPENRSTRSVLFPNERTH